MLPIKDKHINAHKCSNKCHVKLQSARGHQQQIFNCNYVTGRDDIYDNALNVLEKCTRYESRVLRKHGTYYHFNYSTT